MKFNMILVIAGEDYLNINKVIENSNKFIKPELIYIISPKKDIENNYNLERTFKNVKLIDEKEIIDIKEIDFDSISLPGFPERKFWYYQQFLKMAFSYSSYCLDEYYLIWDADTIPLKNINFVSSKGEIYLTVSSYEYHKDYFNNIKIIFGDDFKVKQQSFISQHLFVNKKHMIWMIENIGNTLNHDWCNKLLNKLSGKSNSLFSEYETYCNYVLNKYPKNYKIIKRKWFRRGAFIVNKIENINKFSKYYEYIAIEKIDKNFLKYCYFNIIHYLNMLTSFISNLQHRNAYESDNKKEENK